MLNKALYGILILLNVFFIFSTSFAQKTTDSEPFSIKGNSHIYSQFSTRQANYQQIPRNHINLKLNNTVNVYGIPLRASIFLTSINSDARQNSSNFSIGLNPRTLAKSKITGKMKFLSWFPTLEAGNCHPSYSPLTLNGINLKGVNVEFNPGGFYSAFAKGKLKRVIQETTNPVFQEYERTMTFGRIGYGKKDGTQFILSMLHAKDDPESLNPDGIKYRIDPDTLVLDVGTFIHGVDSGYMFKMPQENYVSSAEFNLVLLKKKLSVKSEIAGSLTTDNQNALDIIYDKIPEVVSDKLFFNTATKMDYAFAVRPVLNLRTTQVSGGMRRIGPGFRSLGVAYLRSNVTQYDAGITQHFNRKKIRAQAFFKHNIDNVTEWNPRTSKVSNYGINTTFRIKKSLFLTALYSQYDAESLINEMDVTYEANNFSITSGYRKKFGDISTYTTAMFTRQLASNNLEEGDNELTNSGFFISEMINLKFPISFFGSFGLTNAETNLFDRKTITLNGRVTYTGIKSMKNVIGISNSNWQGDIRRNKIYFISTFDFKKFGKFTLQADHRIYSNKLNPDRDYKDFVLRMGLIHRW
jgi:hypothetical protein